MFEMLIFNVIATLVGIVVWNAIWWILGVGAAIALGRWCWQKFTNGGQDLTDGYRHGIEFDRLADIGNAIAQFNEDKWLRESLKRRI